MRILVGVGVAAAFACAGFAQRPGIGGRAHPFSISDPGYVARLQATVSGTPGYTGAPTGGGRAPRVVPVLPYAVPFYVGGYFQPPAPPLVMVAPAQQPSTQVIVNQFYTPETAKPRMREYGENGEEISGVRVYSAPTLKPATEEPAATNRESQPPVYLVAFKDNSIQSVMAFWREGAALHYVTVQGDHKTAPLTSFDENFTGQLNRQRGLEFKLKGR
jgi:hypothetical protein